MQKLSDTQRRILEAAAAQPEQDVREHMQALKSPAIRDKVITSMLNHGLIAEDSDTDGLVYVITDAGYAAIGQSKPDALDDDTAEENEPAATELEAKAPAKMRAPKPKREGASKKQTMIDMLSRGEGATIAQLMQTIGWQKHSVHGAMANLKKELQKKHGQSIIGSKDEGAARVYKIA